MKYGKITTLSAITALSLGMLNLNAYAADQTATQPAEQAQAQTQSPADVNKAKGDAFLAANKKKKGVMTTASGLQYKVLSEGNGPTPTSSDIVKVDYRGTLINGTEFDSSYKRGEPAVFPVNGVIPGWTEALQMMKVGATWELYIPAELAYGERGVAPDIGPNETLIFKVTLLGIEK